jgi:hypothetical protein
LFKEDLLRGIEELKSSGKDFRSYKFYLSAPILKKDRPNSFDDFRLI